MAALSNGYMILEPMEKSMNPIVLNEQFIQRVGGNVKMINMSGDDELSLVDLPMTK